MLGERIKNIRKGKSLTQQVFAARLGTSSGFVSEIENGIKMPGYDFILSLKREFDIDLNWLIGGMSAPVVSKLETGYAADNDLVEMLQRILKEADPAKKTVLRSMLVALDPGKKGK